MKALVLHGPRDLRYGEVREPVPAPGEAVVQVVLAGICGSDLHAYHGTQPFFVYPQTPGHEAVGHVVALGPGVPPDALGARVVLDPTVSCGRCYPCRVGRGNCCADLRVLGVHLPGVMAERFVAPWTGLVRVPDHVPDEVAVLAEPLSIAHHALSRARVRADDRVAIIGAGCIGQVLLLMCRREGAACLLIDPARPRLDLAARLGADAVVDPAGEDPSEAVRRFTGGEGASVVFEAVGHPETIRSALDLASNAGRVVILGLCSHEVSLPGSVFVRKELDVLGSRLHGGSLPAAVALLAEGAVEPRPLLSGEVPLAEGAQAFAEAGARDSSPCIETVLRAS